MQVTSYVSHIHVCYQCHHVYCQISTSMLPTSKCNYQQHLSTANRRHETLRPSQRSHNRCNAAQRHEYTASAIQIRMPQPQRVQLENPFLHVVRRYTGWFNVFQLHEEEAAVSFRSKPSSNDHDIENPRGGQEKSRQKEKIGNERPA